MFLKVILFTGLMTVPLQAMDTEALTSLKAMEKVFARSEKDHTESMAAIMKDMTLNKAWEVVEKGKFTDLMRLHRGLGGKKKSLRNGGSDDRLLLQLKTSSHKANGVESARAMLNDVIYESMEKYDNAISECTAFYAKQCSEMKDCRSQIDSSNYMC